MSLLYQWICNIRALQMFERIRTTYLIYLVIGLIGYSTIVLGKNIVTQDISAGDIPRLARMSVRKAKSNPSSETYLEAAQSIQLWWVAYNVYLESRQTQNVPIPTFTKGLMLEYAKKSAELGNFEAANFMAVYYRQDLGKLAGSKKIADCWDDVVSSYASKAVNRDQLTKKCLKFKNQAFE
jgi:hypothetical protein